MPESRTTKKSSPVKKTSQTAKRATKRTARPKAKKPKVVLAKNKVALFCALISGICVLALALSVFLNIEEKVQAQETVQTAQIAQAEKKAEPVKETPQKQKTPVAQTQPTQPKKQAPAAQSVQSQPVKQATSQTAKPSANEPKKAEPSKTAKQTAVAQTKQTQPSQTKPQTPVKTVSQSQAKSAQASTPAASTQKTTNAPIAPQTTSAPSRTSAHVASAKTPAQTEQIQKQVPKNRFDIPPASNGATIVIIIDDAGRSAENTKRYAALPFPITIAVLPKLPQTRACADVIRAAGQEVILHQPMQSMNLKLDPGPGKITENMSSYEIAAVVKENLAELGPGVKGMNNHEGSLITSNVIKIGTVLDVCDEMGVYFLDSRTTAATKAPQAALERDMHIFEKAGPYLDNDIDRAKMLERMRETLAYANRHGRAIVIGHVDKSVKILPDLLAEMYPEMKAAGYRFATPSMLK